MLLKWIESLVIARSLIGQYLAQGLLNIRFTDLREGAIPITLNKFSKSLNFYVGKRA